MPTIKSFSVGLGDMFYIRHGTDNFSTIDCCLSDDNQERILSEIAAQSYGKGVTRFISTHPDQDHISGIELLDEEMPIRNFYVVKNQATKPIITDSFRRYCELRDSDKAFYLSAGCRRRWMNQEDDERGSSGLNILWPNLANVDFKQALIKARDGVSYNNMSLVCRYQLNNGGSALWLGDLETEFMENISGEIDLYPTDVVFAAHHGRKSGKIPNSWLDILKPKVIVLGEAPSRDLNYYSGYNTLTQNRCGDITMEFSTGQIDFYVSEYGYGRRRWLKDYGVSQYSYYIGSLDV